MKLTADTNLLVRIVVRDDEAQAKAALGLVSRAERVVLSLSCLCEFVWVLDSVYGYGRDSIAAALRSLLEPENVVVETPIVEAGLRMLSVGGDFADAVIAASGVAVGAEVFVSFDRKAIARLGAAGIPARYAGQLV